MGADGCDSVPFDPSLNVQSSSQSSDSPTGISVDVNVPQPQNPTGVTESNLKKAVVTLPEGTSINPAAADGLAGCTEAQIALSDTSDPSCPDASKIGSVADRQPAAARSAAGSDLSGHARRQPVRQPAGDLHRRPGRRRDRQAARRDRHRPATGQVTATIDNAPQLPFSQFSLSFFGGPRGALATPTTCGTKTATARLSSWSRPNARPAHRLLRHQLRPERLGLRGHRRRAPVHPEPRRRAGKPGRRQPEPVQSGRQPSRRQPADLDHRREPARGRLGGARLGRPVRRGPGRHRHLRRSDSQVGTVSAKVGAGTNPFQITGGAVYVAGPYKGAPLSLSIVVPAQAGIFDLGTVVVRAAVFVDPTDAHLRVVSDPVPQILDGIPLRLRQIALSIDRQGFITSPTNCDAKQVSAASAGPAAPAPHSPSTSRWRAARRFRSRPR